MKRKLSKTFIPGARPVQAQLKLDVGDSCDTLVITQVNAEEDEASSEVAVLPASTGFEVTNLGIGGRRCEINSGMARGWISYLSPNGAPLVNKRSAAMLSVLNNFLSGNEYEVTSAVTTRTSQDLGSEAKAVLKPGAHVQILDFGAYDRRRALVRGFSTGNGMGVTGWISIATVQGQPLISAKFSKRRAETTIEFEPKFLRIKSFLEAAALGDLATLRKVIQQNSVNKLDLNCTDIRGKSALMFAATFGQKFVVETLLETKEIDISAVDDTQRNALHHAARRSTLRRGDQADVFQVQIVGLLLNRGIALEARDHNGCTALFFAVANGDEAVTKALLSAQANVNVCDYEGKSIFDYAWNFGHANLVDLLTESENQQQDKEKKEPDDKPSEAQAQAEQQPPAEQQPAPEEPKQEGTQSEQKPEQPPQDGGAEAPASSAAAGESAEGAKASKASSGSASGSKHSAAADDARPAAEAGADRSKSKSRKESAAGLASQQAMEAKMRGTTTTSAGMMEALEAEDGAEVAVDCNAAASSETVDEKARAISKLKALVENASTTEKELGRAIKAAQALGADESEVQEAEALRQELKARQKAVDKLQQAVADRDVHKLRKAIARAQEVKVPPGHLEHAESVLAAEEPRQEARDELVAAEESGDTERLRAALAHARKVGLDSSELVALEEMLSYSESKEKAESGLRAAMASKDVTALKFAIRQAKDAGADKELIKEAKAIEKEEKPKHKAREMLASALEQGTMTALREALEAAQAAGLAEPEWEKAAQMLAREEEKEKLLAVVAKAMEESREVDVSSIDALRAAKGVLGDALKKAASAGVTETDLLDAEARRKRLHNMIEDLKGSIRVFCRVRPLSGTEQEQGAENITKPLDSMTLEVNGSDRFQFDAVFFPGTQEEIFEDCRDLVQSALDGYNVTIFAYGQTGAGKTHTMHGRPGAEGIAPRTIQELYRCMKSGKKRYKYTVLGSMLELYRNDFVDLLSKGNPTATTSKLALKTDKSGGVMVDNLTEEECAGAAELSALLDRGNQQRSVAETMMNSESSRSHLVLLIKIVTVNRETKEQYQGKILICDLAGSERLKKSGATEDLQKEAIEINKSLTALGDVIEALTKSQKVIPYRNHKLTQLMQDSLGGTAKTLMFVNCSPASTNLDETTMSLKYATRAKRITNQAPGPKRSKSRDQQSAAASGAN